MARPKGIVLAIARAGAKAPALVASKAHSSGSWSRRAALDWLLERAGEKADMLIGFDFSFALPFEDHSAYFPDWKESPSDAKSLWAAVDELCTDEPNLSASSLPEHAELARHFRYQYGGTTHVGDQFEPGLGRLRVTERLCREQKRGNASSCFNLIGASQVGKSSLTGMRVLHRLNGKIPVWPFDPIPNEGPMLAEIYTGLAARTAGLSGPTKMRNGETLDSALTAIGSQPHAPLSRYDDHSTDALLTTAWLRKAASDQKLWHPRALTPALAQKEGWTFGVR